MKNPLTINSNPDLLYPEFRELLLAAIELANHDSRTPEGLPKFPKFNHWGLFELYRSPARQMQLFQQGKTPAKISDYHSVGLAADVVWYDDKGNPHWDGAADLWGILGHCIRAQGLTWGGGWANRDLVHAQCTLDQRKKWLAKSRKRLRDLGYATA